MRKYNGKGPDYCKNCGGGEGIHRGDDLACPANGVDQTGKQYPRYIEGSVFDPQEGQEDIEKWETQEIHLFDRYLIAAITGLTTISGLSNERIVNDAFDIAKSVMLKRTEYYKAVGI